MAKKSLNIKIIISERAKNELPRDQNIEFIDANLTREEYCSWMKFSDLILLPYYSESYRARSSGVFIEAICAGAIPITTKNTWMASELEKFGLEKLLVDWQSDNLVEIFQSILKDQQIRQKLVQMQQHYRSFHSIENFAKTMRAIIHS